jgi:AcrR family transcriptional regulator
MTKLSGSAEGELSSGVKTATQVLEPRKRPRQQRAKETVSAILEAAAELFSRLGYSGTTTNKIALRAGVSIGSLYQYFPNKDAILAGLEEQHLSQVRAVVEQSLIALEDEGRPVGDTIRSLLEGLVELHDANPDLTRALSHETGRLHSARDTHRQREALYAREVERVLSRRRDVRPGNTAVMAHIVVQTTEALTRWLVHEAPRTLERGVVVEETVRLLTQYVQGFEADA